MKTLPRILFAVTAVGALSVAYPASVQAVPTTYKYTGNPFTFIVGSSYTTSDYVSGILTLAAPLASNMPLTSVTPIAFSFSDGVQTRTNLNTFFSAFQFATGPTWRHYGVGHPGLDVGRRRPGHKESPGDHL